MDEPHSRTMFRTSEADEDSEDLSNAPLRSGGELYSKQVVADSTLVMAATAGGGLFLFFANLLLARFFGVVVRFVSQNRLLFATVPLRTDKSIFKG